MEVKIKKGNEMLDATIEMVDGVMVVSPKEEKFEPKDGDVVYQSCFKDESRWCIYIVKEYTGLTSIPYVFIDNDGYEPNMSCICHTDKDFIRPATEEEKKLLFDKLAEEGYEWDAEKRELVKLKWRPKYNDNYWSPSLFVNEFIPWMNSWKNSKIGNKRLEKGWVFRTEEECQAFCDKLDEAINSVKP